MTSITWYKRYHGAAFDPKITAAAEIANSEHCRALGVWDAALEMSSENEERGCLAGVDLRVIAAGLRLTVDEVKRIWDAFISVGMIVGDRIAKWVKRQGEATLVKAQKIVSAGAKRTANYRRRKAEAAREPEIPGLSKSVTSSVTRAVTSAAEREVEVEEEDSEAVASESIAPNAPVVQMLDYQRRVKHVRGTRRSRIAPDWHPDCADRQYAEDRGYDREWIERQAERFRDNHLKKGSVFADWHAAWRNWVQAAADFARSDSAGRAGENRGGSSPLTIALRRLMPAGDARMAL